jgi:hypothetical protein
MTEAGTSLLHVRIAEALDELRGARAQRDHSPNSDTELMVDHAERRLNELLDQQSMVRS